MAPERVASLAALATDAATYVVVGDVPVCLVKIDGGELHAIHDTCTHADVSLSEGDLDIEGRMIECWKHGSCFSLVDGHPDVLPAVKPVAVFQVWTEGDDVYVDVEVRK